MGWTMKMRLTSVAVTIYLALAEYLLIAIPVGILLRLAGAPVARVVAIGIVLAALWALVIVLISHARPLAIRTPASDGDQT